MQARITIDMDDQKFFQLCEALLFVSPDPVKAEDIQRCLGKDTVENIQEMLQEFKIVMNSRQSALEVVSVAGGYQLVTRSSFTPYIRRMNTIQAQARLSRAALETLAIITYRQPVTIPEIEHIRGVDCSGVVKNLLDKDLVTILGKRKVPGNPLLYGTTTKFLIDFGLADLQSLPEIEAFRKVLSRSEEAGPELPFQKNGESVIQNNNTPENGEGE